MIIFFSVFLTLPSNAQMRPQAKRWSKAKRTPPIYRDWMFGMSAGTALYYGGLSNDDLDPLKKIPNESNLSYSVYAGKWVKSYLALRANFQMGDIHSVKGPRDMNANFFEYNAQMMINLTDLFNHKTRYQRKLYSYVGLGFGMINFSSSVYNSDTDIWVYEGQEKRTNEWEVPATVGLGYNLNQNFTFTIDATYHYANTDKLDAFQNGSKDFLLYLALGVNYNFNVKQFKSSILRPKSQRSLKWVKF